MQGCVIPVTTYVHEATIIDDYVSEAYFCVDHAHNLLGLPKEVDIGRILMGCIEYSQAFDYVKYSVCTKCLCV